MKRTGGAGAPVKRTPQATPALIIRIRLAIDSLGGARALPALLGVNESQALRRRTGEETPSSDMQRRIIDLDHVVARAQTVWEPESALDRLGSTDNHLNGAVPLDVLELRGPAEVLDALDAVLSGAYALPLVAPPPGRHDALTSGP